MAYSWIELFPESWTHGLASVVRLQIMWLSFLSPVGDYFRKQVNLFERKR